MTTTNQDIIARLTLAFIDLRMQKNLSDDEVAVQLNKVPDFCVIAPGQRWNARSVRLWAKLYQVSRKPGPRAGVK